MLLALSGPVGDRKTDGNDPAGFIILTTEDTI